MLKTLATAVAAAAMLSLAACDGSAEKSGEKSGDAEFSGVMRWLDRVLSR